MKLSVIVTLVLFMPSLVSAAPSTGKPSAPIPVITKTVSEQDVFDKVEALGTLKARESVTLTASVTEKVTVIHFEDGQRVSAGDVLVEMTNEEESADLSAEKSTLNEARRQVQRLKPLVDDGAASPSVLDERKREYETAQARLRAIQSRISDRIITAPFDGVLGLRNISIGAVLQPGMIITTLDDDRQMKLDFPIPSTFLQTLKTGVTISASSASFLGREFPGTIQSINSQIDPETRSIMVRAVIDNPEGILRPGLLMQVDIMKNPRRALMIPEESLVSLGRKNFVYVIDNQKDNLSALKREVIIGTRTPGYVEITGGLKAGEIVIVHGAMRLSDQSPVRVRGTLDNGETISEILKTPDEKTTPKSGGQ